MRSEPAPTLDTLSRIEYSPEPAVLLFSDDPDQRVRIGAIVRAAGGRVSVALGLGEAVERITEHARPDGVVIDAISAPEAVLEQIFETLDHGARSQRFQSIALIDRDQIDLAAARAGHKDVHLLCGPDDRTLIAAIKSVLSPKHIELNDGRGQAAEITLRQLTEEVGRIAQTLAALSDWQGDDRRFSDGPSKATPAPPAVDAAAIRAMIRARRLRDQFFQSALFADPAWDMLLDLTAAQMEGQSVSVSSLCVAAAVPSTTALRWIKTLTDLGMFVRVADAKDRRRVFIMLSADVFDAMQACLARIWPLGGV